MAVNLDNLYYRHSWHDCSVDYYEGYLTKMMDFHAHDYYEVSLILTGYVKVFLSDSVQEGSDSRLVLTGPKTPHFIWRDPNVFYSRLNLLFSDEFIANYIPESKQLLSSFGKDGRVITLSQEQTEFFQARILEIQAEKEPFRQRLMILCLLSHIAEAVGKDETEASELPRCVTGALTYIGEHYSEKILASDLAWRLGVCRTTLMTSFKKYTGSTLGDYLMRCRAKNALRMMREGMSEHAAAEACGCGDMCGLIRAFKKCYGMTPRQYMIAERQKRSVQPS